jgi:hypothetical protein
MFSHFKKHTQSFVSFTVVNMSWMLHNSKNKAILALVLTSKSITAAVNENLATTGRQGLIFDFDCGSFEYFEIDMYETLFKALKKPFNFSMNLPGEYETRHCFISRAAEIFCDIPASLYIGEYDREDLRGKANTVSVNICNTYYDLRNNSVVKGTTYRTNSSITALSFGDEVEAICSTQILAFESIGRPMGIRMGYLKGEVTPESCVSALTDKKVAANVAEDCIAGLSASANWKRNLTKNELYNEIKTNISKPLAFFIKQAFSQLYTFTFSEAQSEHYTSLVLQLFYIKKYYKFAQEAKRNNLGYSKDHAAYTLIEILRSMNKYQKNLHMHLVTLHSDAGNQLTFLYLADMLQEVIFKNSKKDVSEFLANLKSGYICDTENMGLFVKGDLNDNKLYREGWDSLSVLTISSEFDTSSLPEEAEIFINEELEKMGLVNLYGRPYFSFFAKKSASSVVIDLEDSDEDYVTEYNNSATYNGFRRFG